MNSKFYIGLLVVVITVSAGWVITQSLSSRQTIPSVGTSTAMTEIRTSTPGSFDVALETYFIIDSRDSILVTDSQGHRVGQDPATGNIYKELPGSQYFDAQYTEAEVPNTPSGSYTIAISGSGRYTLQAYIGQGLSPVAPQVISGTLTPGKRITYTQNYDPDNLASSTLTLGSTTEL